MDALRLEAASDKRVLNLVQTRSSVFEKARTPAPPRRKTREASPKALAISLTIKVQVLAAGRSGALIDNDFVGLIGLGAKPGIPEQGCRRRKCSTRMADP